MNTTDRSINEQTVMEVLIEAWDDLEEFPNGNVRPAYLVMRTGLNLAAVWSALATMHAAGDVDFVSSPEPIGNDDIAAVWNPVTRDE